MKLDIEKFDPCEDGLEWYSLQKSSVQAWNDCPRGDWMLWIAVKLGVDKKKIILSGAKCANTVRHLMKDKRSRNAVDTLIAYGEGRATEEEFEKTIAAAVEASMATVESYMAADEASMAADEAARAAVRSSAAAAAFAAFFAVEAAFHADGESTEAREVNQLQTANICREILTDDIMKIIEKSNENTN